MMNEKLLAKSFIYWVGKYNHRDGYQNLGEALMSWLLVSSNAEGLDYDYARFLTLVDCLLQSEQKILKAPNMDCEIIDGQSVLHIIYTSVTIPNEIGDWLPTQSDFDIASKKCKLRQIKFEQELINMKTQKENHLKTS